MKNEEIYKLFDIYKEIEWLKKIEEQFEKLEAEYQMEKVKSTINY